MKRYEVVNLTIDLELDQYEEEQNIEVEFLTEFTTDHIEEVRLVTVHNIDDNEKQIDLKVLSNRVKAKIEDECWDKAEDNLDQWVDESNDVEPETLDYTADDEVYH